MNPTKRNNLAGVTSGVFKVTTEGSSYVIDYDNKRAKRIPGVSAEAMRKDGDWFSFITVVAEVGGPMFIWASDIADIDGTFTNRRTSPVVLIESL